MIPDDRIVVIQSWHYRRHRHSTCCYNHHYDLLPLNEKAFVVLLLLVQAFVRCSTFSTTYTAYLRTSASQESKLKAPDISPNPPHHLFINRTVTFQPAPTRQGVGLPLQIYRSQQPPSQITQSQSRRWSSTTTTMKPNLSHSSQHLLQQYHSLTLPERTRLRDKLAKEAQASQPLDSNLLHVLYRDSDLCVVVKPSGVLSVPGPRRNPSIAGLAFDVLQPPLRTVDQMVVHRLDMDTSGLLVLALSELALHRLHDDFRTRRVHKVYQALVEGHWDGPSEVELDLALERDPWNPPFMRVAQPDSTTAECSPLTDPIRFAKLQHDPKPSWTDLHVLGWEWTTTTTTTKDGIDLDSCHVVIPVTRVRLQPHTGRTHQLRVHTAALGYPIVGDDIYGKGGEGHGGPSLCLCAHQLRFFHPRSGAPLQFECPPGF